MATNACLAKPAPVSVGVLPVASVVLTGVASSAIIVAIPGLLAGMSTHLDLTSSQIALVNSSEMAGITATTLAVAALLGRMDRRRAALVGLILIILANLLSAFASTFLSLIAARFIAGLAAGALQGIVSASIAATPIPDRIFAIYLTANLMVTTIMLALLSRFSAAGHPEWLFITVVALAAGAALLLRWLPAGSAANDKKAENIGQHPVIYGLAALLGTFILLVGIGLTWPLVGMLGLERQLSGETVARTLSFATIGGIAASILVSAGGSRLGRRLPILVGAAGLSIAALTLVLQTDVTSFTAAAFVFMFCWILILPYCSGVVATLDLSGRLAVLWITMQFAGLATGPVIAAGLLLSSPDLPFYVALACFCVAATLILYAERGSRSAQEALEN